jgi:peptidyl-prolyl cis-trans isomerase B (cyclophilin B)
VPSKDRQRAIARAKLERQMANRARAARRRRQMQAGIGALVALVAVVAGTTFLVMKFDDSKKSDADTAAPKDPTPSAEPTATPTPAASLAPGECAYNKAAGGQVKNVGTPPTKNVAHKGTRTATIQLGQGTIEVTLDLAKTPCTANSFAFLASKKYFDGSTCHRMTDAGIFVLQCGDPFGKGTGGPGYQFNVENLPKASANPYPAGTLAMANSGSPDSNGSQFFIVYKDGSQLGPDYTPFGKVTKGLDIVTAIGKVGHDGSFDPQPGGGKPKQPVKLEKVTVSAIKS